MIKNGFVVQAEFTNMAVPFAISGACSATVGDHVYVFGGRYNTGEASDSIYDINTLIGSIELLGTHFNQSIASLSCVAYQKHIYIFGGYHWTGNVQNPLDTIYDFDTETKTFVTHDPALPTLSKATYDMSCSISGTKILLFGGQSTDLGTNNLVQYYTFGADYSLTARTGSTHDAKAERTYSASVGSDFYVFGGTANTTFHSFNTTNKYNVNAGDYSISKSSVTATGDPLTKMNNASAASVGNHIYIFGGYDSWRNKYMSDVFDFNPSDSSFTKLSAKLSSGRSSMASSVVGDKVYLIGGGSNTIEIFDTTTKTFI